MMSQTDLLCSSLEEKDQLCFVALMVVTENLLGVEMLFEIPEPWLSNA